MEKYFEFDDWVIQGALKDGKGGKHGEHILKRTPCRKIDEWFGVLSEDIEEKIKSYENNYKGLSDIGPCPVILSPVSSTGQAL